MGTRGREVIVSACQAYCRVFGGILISAGLLKAWDLKSSQAAIAGIGLTYDMRLAVTLAVCGCESVLGGLLVLGGGVRVRMCALAMAAAFLVVHMVRGLILASDVCSCWGPMHMETSFTVGIVSIACLALVVARRPTDGAQMRASPRHIMLGGMRVQGRVLMCGLLGIGTMGLGVMGMARSETAEELLEERVRGETGEVLVVVGSVGCDECHTVLRKGVQAKLLGVVSRVLFVTAENEREGRSHDLESVDAMTIPVEAWMDLVKGSAPAIYLYEDSRGLELIGAIPW